MKKILTVFGTRPEAIKMAPVIKELANNSNCLLEVCTTAQHREMLDQMLSIFDIRPNYDLNVMSVSQSLSGTMSSILVGLEKVIIQSKPDLILVQGDTLTALTAALSAYFHQIPVGHVEAGLRTYDIYSPWPEEINRKLIASITKFHFAPTLSAVENLISEGIDLDNIHLTGNTVIDALLSVRSKIYSKPDIKKSIEASFGMIDFSKKYLLVTCHRRENFGDSLRNICCALKKIARNNPNIQIVFPVHLNPNIREIVYKVLKDIDNIILIAPTDYMSFLYLLDRCHIVLTDSGGLQEEAPALNKPVLIMRDSTERKEAVSSGVAILVGTNAGRIIHETNLILENEALYNKMRVKKNPFGDGTASKKISKILDETFLSKGKIF